MLPRIVRDPTTSLVILLAPLVGRLIGPGETISSIRREIVEEPPTSIEYQFWRAGTWFFLLATAAAGSLALLVLGDIVDSSGMSTASAVLIRVTGPALVMLLLFAARYGYVSNRASDRKVPELLLRSSALDLVLAILITIVVVLLLA